MGQGILYLLSDARMAELLTVSLWSLRQHYEGPVSVAITYDSRRLASRIAADSRLNIRLVGIRGFSTHSRHDARHTKLLCWMATPFTRTVYLDADTVVLGRIDELLASDGFGVTNAGLGCICDSNSHHQAKRLWGEIVNFQRFGPGGYRFCEDVQRTNLPAINSGVVSFAWPKHQMLIERLHDLVCLARATHRRVTDETVIQLLLPRIDDLRILDSRFNATLISGEDWRRQTIVHFAAQSWRSRRGRSCFWRMLREAYRQNAGGLRRWIGAGNPLVPQILFRKKSQGGASVDEKITH